MNLLNPMRFALALLFALCVGMGCDRAPKPPAFLPLDQLPAAFQKAFAKAEPDTKELANSVVAAVQAKDYPKASFALQALMGRPNLSKEQADVTTRGTLSVHGALLAAQANGDTTAAQTLQYQRKNR